MNIYNYKSMIHNLQGALIQQGYKVFDTVGFCDNISTSGQIEDNLQMLSNSLDSKIAIIHYENMSFDKHFDQRFVNLVKQNQNKIKISFEGGTTFIGEVDRRYNPTKGKFFSKSGQEIQPRQFSDFFSKSAFFE